MLTGQKLGAVRRAHNGVPGAGGPPSPVGPWGASNATPAACLPLEHPAAQTSDLELAWELADATSVLEMGEGGIAAHVAEDLRRRRLDAARELVARWERRP